MSLTLPPSQLHSLHSAPGRAQGGVSPVRFPSSSGPIPGPWELEPRLHLEDLQQRDLDWTLSTPAHPAGQRDS